MSDNAKWLGAVTAAVAVGLATPAEAQQRPAAMTADQRAMVEMATVMFPHVAERAAFTPETAYILLALEMASNARVSTLADLCGIRDAAWGRRVLGWVAASHDTMARSVGSAWTDRGQTGARNFGRGLVVGAQNAGREEHGAQDRAACEELRDSEFLRMADRFAAAWSRGEGPGNQTPRQRNLERRR